jgi:hypothetical protein
MTLIKRQKKQDYLHPYAKNQDYLHPYAKKITLPEFTIPLKVNKKKHSHLEVEHNLQDINTPIFKKMIPEFTIPLKVNKKKHSHIEINHNIQNMSNPIFKKMVLESKKLMGVHTKEVLEKNMSRKPKIRIPKVSPYLIPE